MKMQELEHNQHIEGCDTELRNLYSQAKGEISVPKVAKAYTDWLSLNGFYVVISYVEKFCPFTDATLGTGEYIDLITRNPEEVEHLVELFEFYGEAYKVIPRGGN